MPTYMFDSFSDCMTSENDSTEVAKLKIFIAQLQRLALFIKTVQCTCVHIYMWLSFVII